MVGRFKCEIRAPIPQGPTKKIQDYQLLKAARKQASLQEASLKVDFFMSLKIKWRS